MLDAMAMACRPAGTLGGWLHGIFNLKFKYPAAGTNRGRRIDWVDLNETKSAAHARPPGAGALTLPLAATRPPAPMRPSPSRLAAAPAALLLLLLLLLLCAPAAALQVRFSSPLLVSAPTQCYLRDNHSVLCGYLQNATCQCSDVPTAAGGTDGFYGLDGNATRMMGLYSQMGLGGNVLTFTADGGRSWRLKTFAEPFASFDW
eukprot:SAG31_NODE_6389_length_2035_cov_1.978306_2_plen_203_part_00